MRPKKTSCKNCCLPTVFILLITLLLLPIAVNAEGQELATVEITSVPPFSISLEIGQSVIFTAEGKDADGNTVPIPDPQWYSDDTHGTIVVDPDNPNKCTYTATDKGEDYMQCCDGPAGTGVHGSRDFNVAKSGGGSNNDGGNDSPGFELLLVIIAIGSILYFRKRKNS